MQLRVAVQETGESIRSQHRVARIVDFFPMKVTHTFVVDTRYRLSGMTYPSPSSPPVVSGDPSGIKREDGCPIKYVGHDHLSPSSSPVVSGDPSVFLSTFHA